MNIGPQHWKLMAVIWLLSIGQAQAHSLIPGVTGFPMLMLHPLAAPDQLLLLLAGILLAARVQSTHFATLPSVWVAGMFAGKVLHLLYSAIAAYWYLPFIVTILAAGSVAALGRLGVRAGITLLFLLGALYSIAIIPEEPTFAGLVEALLAALLTSLLLMAGVSLPLRLLRGKWIDVAVRALASWLCAYAVLLLAASLRLIA